MGEVVEYSRRDANVRGETASGSGGGGGTMLDDILKRLGVVEQGLAELRTQVSAILALIPHLATKADVALIPHLATKADVEAVRCELATMQATIIKWYVATSLTVAGLAFAAARFIH